MIYLAFNLVGKLKYGQKKIEKVHISVESIKSNLNPPQLYISIHILHTISQRIKVEELPRIHVKARKRAFSMEIIHKTN